MKDASFMEIRGAWIVYQKLKSRIGPEQGKEGVVIDKKGFRLWGCWRHKGGSCEWLARGGARGSMEVHILP